MYVGTVSADTLYTGGVVYTRTTHTSEQHDMTRYNTYFPLDKQVISETFCNGEKLNLTRQKHAFTN